MSNLEQIADNLKVDLWHCIDDHRDFDDEEAIQLIKKALQTYADEYVSCHIPEGYKLVPVEPTDEMIQAGLDSVMKDQPLGFAQNRTKLAYKAMLAAAPEVGS